MRSVITRVSVFALIGSAALFAQGLQPGSVTTMPAVGTLDGSAAVVAPPAPTVTSLLGSLGALINPDTPIPAHGLFIFGGNQGQNLIGGFAICDAPATLNVICAVTSHVGATTATTLEGEQILIAQHGFIGFINGNAGIAVGANGGAGFAAQWGGGASYNVSRFAFMKAHPGYWLGVHAGWDKRDVDDFISAASTLPGARSALVAFGKKTSVQFFLGKTW